VAVRKSSGSVDEDLARRVEDYVHGRSLSGFASRAVDHKLERDALAGYLDELDAEFGPVSPELVEHHDALWP
jgi:hypothetical protein